jgi:exopolysaccharide biosynthesis polyprenyl glycosylphosphotransferase
MLKRFSVNYMLLCFLLDTLIIQAALYLSIQLRYSRDFWQPWTERFSGGGSLYVPGPGLFVSVALLTAFSFLVFDVYTPRRVMYWYDEARRVLLAHVLSVLALAGLLYLANVALPRLTYGYYAVLALCGFYGYRALFRIYFRLRRNTGAALTRLLVVGAGSIGGNIVREMQKNRWPGIRIVGFLDDDAGKQGRLLHEVPVLGPIDHALQLIDEHQIGEVLIALPTHAHSRIANLVAELYERPVRVRVVPAHFELAFYGASIVNVGGIPLIGLREPAIDGVQRLIKRLFDLLVAGIGLLLIAPLLLIIAILIKLNDGGPILYRAQRVGENGRIFTMFKFRSMVVGADRLTAVTAPVIDAPAAVPHKVRGDPRVTRIGGWLRRTSLDELPQLFNVLRGDMSLVGPRPELPGLVGKYEPWQRKRFGVPQGMTGWWQINGRSDNPMHLHTELDLYYIQHYSLWLDIQILWRTVDVVVRGRGAF